MKKSYIALLSTAMLLTLAACGQPANNSSENISSSQTETVEKTESTTSSEEETEIVSSETNTSEEKTSEEISSEEVSSETSSNESTSGDEIIDAHSALINFTGLSVTTDDFNRSEYPPKFVEWFNTQAGAKNDNILSSIEVEGTVSTKKGGENSTYDHITLGGKSSLGKLTFNFAKDIKEIKFGCSAYWKSWNNSHNSGFSIDKGMKFEAFVGNESIDVKALPHTENGPQEIVTISKKLNASAKSFSVTNVIPEGNELNRVFLENIYIAW